MAIRRGSPLAVLIAIPLAAAAVYGLFIDYSIVVWGALPHMLPLLMLITALALPALWFALYIAWPRPRALGLTR